jgi:GTP-binding protein HflX
VSAVTGEGLEALLSALEVKLSAIHRTMTVDVAASDGALLHWIYENASVLERVFDEDKQTEAVTIRISPEKAAQLEGRLRDRAAARG